MNNENNIIPENVIKDEKTYLVDLFENEDVSITDDTVKLTVIDEELNQLVKSFENSDKSLSQRINELVNLYCLLMDNVNLP